APWAGGSGGVRPGGGPRRPAQRIPVAPRLDPGEMRRLAVTRHADERGVLREPQTAARDLVTDRGPPGMVGNEREVSAEQLMRIAHERLPDAVGEERDARDACDGDHQGERENAQFSGPPIATEHAERQREVPGRCY